MRDFEPYVFSQVENAVKQEMPEVVVLPELVATPPSFPCVAVYEADNSTYQDSQLGDGVDHHVNVMYTAEAFSTLDGGGKYQCKLILQVVDRVMRSMGFQRTASLEVDNYDRTISRRVSRYTGIIGENGIVYKN